MPPSGDHLVGTLTGNVLDLVKVLLDCGGVYLEVLLEVLSDAGVDAASDTKQEGLGGLDIPASLCEGCVELSMLLGFGG